MCSTVDDRSHLFRGDGLPDLCKAEIGVGSPQFGWIPAALTTVAMVAISALT
jgi:hypothetical protein